MSRKIVTEKIEPVLEETQPSPLFDAARRVMLAYVGGMAMAWDEIEDLINRFVERGEVAEKDARKLMHELAERRRHMVADKRVEDMLHKMDMPAKSDIEALSAKVAALTHKVDELKKA